MNDWRARPIDNVLYYYIQSIASEQEDSCNSPATSSHGRWFSIKRENSNCMAEYLSEKLLLGFERYLYIIIYIVYTITHENGGKKLRPIEWVFRLYCPSRDDDYNDVPPFRRDDMSFSCAWHAMGRKKIVFFICLFSFPLSKNHLDIYIYVCTTNNLLNFSFSVQDVDKKARQQ